jgi:predicted HTH domain antitoxin
MNTQTIKIEIPSDILIALNQDEKELTRNIKFELAMKMYQKEKLTIGKAAQLAGLSRLEFENLLAENRIPISNLNYEDIQNDIRKLF